MEIINRLRLSLEGIEQKDFYKYLGITFGVLFVVMSAVIFWHYRTVSTLTHEINDLNVMREDRIRSILERKDTVEQQRKEINLILAKEENFILANYFQQLLQRLSLNVAYQKPSVVELSNDYQEEQLTARFNGLKMKQLTELLNEIEQKERVYAKELEIIRSTKTPKTIEVNLVIATLQPKLGTGA